MTVYCAAMPQVKAVPPQERPVLSLSVTVPVPIPLTPPVGVSDEGPNAKPVTVVSPSPPNAIREGDAGTPGSRSGTC